MRPLVECVPNFSEGRRQEVIEAIVNTIRSAGAVHVLDVSSDPDHNRSVVTLVGPPEELEQAMFAAIRTAAENINMEEHSGEHPRFGATDVVPFIPIRDVSMEDCVEMAGRLAKRVGETLDIPVYLYEEAATKTERQNLAKIRSRKFQYEQLKTAIETDPARMPDFGPAKLGAAGATIIGARPPLIAFNVYLTTDDVEIAKKIGRAVRASSGGLAFVKGAGFLVEGKAQVSMNLTNYQKTPVFRVVEMIRREAHRYGVEILSSELVGLAPQEAFIDSAQWYLQLDGFQPDQLLETRIAQAEAEAQASPLAKEEPPVPEEATGQLAAAEIDQASRPSAFVEAVGAAKPTPGGGSVSAQVAALAAALAQMVAGLTIGKKRYAEVEDEMQAVQKAAEDLRNRLLDDVVKDAQAFDQLMSAFRLPKENPDRTQVILEKTLEAAIVPRDVCRQAYEALQLIEKVARAGNKNAATDAAVAAHMALASMEGAALNVRVNLLDLEDNEPAQQMQTEVEALLAQARSLKAQIINEAEKRSGLAS
ncbi:MAG: glutamate formimidoyltransferase [Chloroflexi bacterium]|nr:glutamate formimidoyltransferase [Chloroflexota bacterium]